MADTTEVHWIKLEGIGEHIAAARAAGATDAADMLYAVTRALGIEMALNNWRQYAGDKTGMAGYVAVIGGANPPRDPIVDQHYHRTLQHIRDGEWDINA